MKMENHKGEIPNFGMYTPYNPRDVFRMDDLKVGMIAYRVADESLEDRVVGEFHLLDPFFRKMKVNPSGDLYNTNSHIGFTETPMGKTRRMFRDLESNPEKYKRKK